MITVNINTTDRSALIDWDSLRVEQNLTSLVDTAAFRIKKYGSISLTPAVGDDIEIYDGTEKIFAGEIASVDESPITGADGLQYDIKCVDYSFQLGNILVAESYESKTVKEIIDDIITNYAPAYTTANVSSSYTVNKIVFNQVPILTCLKKLADLLKYEWYVDENKDVHFFPKFTNTAPYDLTDTSGNYIADTLKRKLDGTQIANRVKVRGGEYDGDTFSDSITVSGNDSKSFKLPYKFSNLFITLNAAPQVLGIDFVDDFTAHDVLYNYNERTIRWENALSAGDIIGFSGNPKVRVLVQADDPASIATYNLREKIIRDDSIEDNTTARKRAQAELQAFKDQADEASFETRTGGLRAGQVINLDSTRRSCDTDFLIKRVVFKTRSREDFLYTVSLITTRKYYLTEILQKLLEPDAEQINDAETAEMLKSISENVLIGESVYRNTYESDEATITITENIQDDPLGEGVEPEWVLAPYFPSSITDPKRVGLLDYSLKLY